MRFYSAERPTRRFRCDLPHWRQDGVVYFVTFRLADSIPAEKLTQWSREREAWLARHPRPWDEGTEKDYLQRFQHRVEHWLDQGSGECVLREPESRRIVEDSLRRGTATHYALDEWVIMPNHVHLLIIPGPGYELSRILQSIKAYTALGINRLLRRRGALWQRESFDHIVRSQVSLERFRRYIRGNPGRNVAGTS